MKTYLRNTWLHSSLVPRPSPIHGTGIFTTTDIKEGDVIMIWGGIVIPQNEYDDTWQKYRNGSVVQISEDYYLGAAIDDEQLLDEYLNHSCDPNTWLIDEVTVAARRNISAGEEITLDSATWNDDDEEEYSDDGFCTCGAIICRKRITGHDWKDKTLQEKYKGHFSPYLERKFNKKSTSK